MPKDLRDAARALLSWTRDGKIPAPGLDIDGALRRPWQGVAPRDGSANHGWLVHSCGYARGETASREYLLQRLRDEIENGLMAWEEMAVTYGALHVAPVAIDWWTAWGRGDEEVGSLAGAWLERVCYLYSLHARVGTEGLEIHAPGMRRDGGGNTRTVAAIVAHLLGLPHSLKVKEAEGSTWAGGLCLQAVREAERIDQCLRELHKMWCLDVIADKLEVRGAALRSIRLLVPLSWKAYGQDSWISRLEGPRPWTHPQDPAQVLGGFVAGSPVELWPFSWEDPPEEGWRVTVNENAGFVHAIWFHRGAQVAIAQVELPGGVALRRVIGYGPVDLEDLPPLPPDPPQRKVDEKPAEPEEPEPDYAGLRERLVRLRDSSRRNWQRGIGHELLVLGHKMGWW